MRHHVIFYFVLMFLVSCVGGGEESVIDEEYINSSKEVVIPTIEIETISNNLIQNISSGKSNIEISGQCLNGSLLSLVLNEKSIDIGTCENSIFIYELKSEDFADGKNNFVINAANEDKSYSTEEYSFILDLEAPTSSIDSYSTINSLNETSYSLSGACSESGRVVSIVVGETEFETQCDAGVWNLDSVDISSENDAPSLSITLSHKDEALNESKDSVSVIKDTSLPTLSLTSSNINISNVGTYSLSGTCSEEGQNVDISLESILVTTSCNSGMFNTGSVDVTSLFDGDVTVSVATVDSAGNSSNFSDVTIQKDVVSPTVTLSSPSIINASNVNAYSVSGTCDVESQVVNVTIGNLSFSPTCSSSSWTTGNVNVQSLSDSGGVSISVNMNDAVGNSALAASGSVVKDTVIPTITLTSSDNINLANQSLYSLSGSCSEEGRAVRVDIGGVFRNLTCSSLSFATGIVDLSALSEGKIDINISTTDTNGNSSSFSTVTINKDTLSFSVSLNPPSDISQDNEKNVVFSGSCSSDNSAVTINVGSGALTTYATCSSGNWITNSLDLSSLSDGVISVDVNHLTAPTASDTFTKDTTLPTVSITSVGDINPANESAFQVIGSCSENGRAVNVDIEGLTFTPNCTSGSWTTGFVDVSSLSDGNVTIRVDHTNASYQNAIQYVQTINKSTTTPSISTLSVPSTLSQSAELNWAAINTSGFTVNDYNIQYRKKFTTVWLSFDDGVNISVGTTVLGLLPSTIYEFRVQMSYDSGSISEWSNIAEGETKPNSEIFSSPYKAMNVGGATTAKVVAFYDDTDVTLNGNPLVTLNKGQTHLFSPSQFDVIDADKPIYTAGRRGSGGDTNKANITFSPTSWAGKSFSFNSIRYNPQKLHVYAIEDTTVSIYQGGSLLTSMTINKDSGDTLSWSQYGSYQVVSTGTVLAYHISGSGTRFVDPKPLLPSATEIIGIPSTSMRLTTSRDSTFYNLWHSNSGTTSNTLDKTDSIKVNPAKSGSQYTSSSLLIRSDKGISGASYADSNGGCAAPFLPTNLMKKNYVLNVQGDWIAFASKEDATISVYSPSQIIGSDTPVQTFSLSRTGVNTSAPFQARITTNAKEGYRFVSTAPVAAWYQPKNDIGGAKRDETILYGTD